MFKAESNQQNIFPGRNLNLENVDRWQAH